MSVESTVVPEEQRVTAVFPRFGECTYASSEVIEFPWGLPGFANLRRWLALKEESHASFTWLQSLDDPKVALPAADPFSLFPQYDPKLPPYAVAALEIQDASDVAILGVVIASEGAAELTMNLLAPIVVNIRISRGRQVVLDNSGYSMREPLPRKSPEDSSAAAAETP